MPADSARRKGPRRFGAEDQVARDFVTLALALALASALMAERAMSTAALAAAGAADGGAAGSLESRCVAAAGRGCPHTFAHPAPHQPSLESLESLETPESRVVNRP